MRTRRLKRALPMAVLLTIGLAGASAAEAVNGTNDADVLDGTARADTIHGYAGNDRIYGHAGNDALFGGRGADKIYGGTGADRLYPGADANRDLLLGGGGPDRIVAKGHDWVYAGGGNDTIVLVHPPALGFAMVHVYCGPGYDRVYSPFGGWLIGGTSGCEKWVS